MQRPILIVGGAPRVAVDAIRHLTVSATGTTAVTLSRQLRQRGRDPHLLLSLDSVPEAQAERYRDRDALELGISSWITRYPDGCVVMTAAVNDYRVSSVERWEAGESRALRSGEKLASGADEVVIRMRPENKIIDRLRPEFGLRGPIVGFKFEAATSVLASADELLHRTNAACVAANSLCGEIQAIVDTGGTERFPDRTTMISELSHRIAEL